MKKDLKKFNLVSEIETLQELPKATFKNELKIKAKDYAFTTFLEKKLSHSKLKELSFSELKMQPYLEDKYLSIEQKRTLFTYRTNMARFKVNYKSSYQEHSCKLCGDHPDDQRSSFSCKEIFKENDETATYETIFHKNIPKKTVDTIMKITETRKSKV